MARCLVAITCLAAANALSLSPGITALVPPCARGCVLSYLEANYAPDTCGETPGLECLCANLGESGFTVGEGAFTCVRAEIEVGGCADADVDGESMVVCGSLG